MTVLYRDGHGRLSAVRNEVGQSAGGQILVVRNAVVRNAVVRNEVVQIGAVPHFASDVQTNGLRANLRPGRTSVEGLPV
jgi:hypothetical protein